MIVYLAGGMHSNWREKIMQDCLETGHEFLDPTEHALEDAEAYAMWDSMAIESADIVFAYMEESNPSGYGMIWEMGYAKGLDAKVIFVDEKADRYMSLAKMKCDAVFNTLEEGIALLRSLALIG